MVKRYVPHKQALLCFHLGQLVKSRITSLRIWLKLNWIRTVCDILQTNRIDYVIGRMFHIPPRPSDLSKKNWNTKTKPFLTSHLWYKAMLNFPNSQIMAGLAVLVSRLKGSQDFLHTFIMALTLYSNFSYLFLTV